MKSTVKISSFFVLILGILSLVFLIYDLYQVNINLPEALDFYESGYMVGIGYVFILLFHFSAIIFLYVHFRQFKELKILKTAALLLAVISLFTLGIEKVMFDEIGREYASGLEIRGELFGLCFAFLINIAFAVLMVLLILKTFRVSYDDIEEEVMDERVFTIAQCMGIVSGILGILLTFNLIGKGIPINRLWIYIPFYVLFLIPYALAVFYWLSIKLKEKITSWYDEKQFQDILKSSLTTMILSFPGLAVFLIIKIPSPVYIFLYYIFLILLIFSSSTLYYFKIKDTV